MANEIKISGRLGQDAEYKVTPSGRPVLNFSVADGRSKPDGNGGWTEARETLWHRCEVWGQLAEMWANSGLLVKSAHVDVTGELTIEEFDRRDGTKGFAPKIKVYSIGVREPSNNQGQQQQNSFAQPQGVEDPWSQDVATDEPPF